MTEQEWLVCTDPHLMLKILEGRSSERKVRLFACVCIEDYLRIMAWPRSDTDKLHAALLIYERYAEGSVNRDGWQRTIGEAFHFSPWKFENPFEEAAAAIETTAGVAGWNQTSCFDENKAGDERRRLANFLHCISGIPFRPASVDAAWLAWNDAAVNRLAEGIYNERAFDRLPILAEALEEAGCANADILAHLRSVGPHVRGCWPIDLILGKS